MGFLKDVFGNFLSLIFVLLAFGCFISAIGSFLFTGFVNTATSPWLWFIIFVVAGLICLAIARAIAKRT